MKVSRNGKLYKQITGGFEGFLDCCPALDRIPFYIKQAAAEAATDAALSVIEFATRPPTPPEPPETCVRCGQTEEHCGCEQFDSERK